MPTFGLQKLESLHVAVVLYVNLLDRILYQRLRDWSVNFSGYEITVTPKRQNVNDLTVTIFPKGWPQSSSIWGRFEGNDSDGWHFWEGGIHAAKLHIPSGEPFMLSFAIQTTRLWEAPTVYLLDHSPVGQFFNRVAREAGVAVAD